MGMRRKEGKTRFVFLGAHKTGRSARAHSFPLLFSPVLALGHILQILGAQKVEEVVLHGAEVLLKVNLKRNI